MLSRYGVGVLMEATQPDPVGYRKLTKQNKSKNENRIYSI